MKAITNYRSACEEVAKAFTKRYFKHEKYGRFTFWCGDEIGGIFSVGDYFFAVRRMLEALENKAAWEQLNDYYNAEVYHAMENPDKPFRINFVNFVKYGWMEDENNSQ